MSKNNKKYRYRIWYYTDRLANNIYNLKCIGEMKINTFERKKHVILHYHKYGMDSTIDAFNVSMSSIYAWEKAYKQGELTENKTTKPKNIRKSKTDPRIRDFIIALREKHWRLGKRKIYPFLLKYCKDNNIKRISIATIGREIKTLKEKGKIRTNKIGHIHVSKNSSNVHVKTRKIKHKKRIKDYKASIPGDIVQIDTIVRFDYGIKRYIFTAIDIYTRMTFAYVYRTHSSKNAFDFFSKLKQIMPFEIKHVQTDNGHEFLKDFQQGLSVLNVTQFFNFPRCPKMNCYIERFNRTLQEDCINKYSTLLEDIDEFNNKLIDYLLWYNTERPHQSLQDISPVVYLIKRCNFTQFSKMYWARTFNCNFSFILIY